MEVLTRVKQSVKGNHTFTETKGAKSGEVWVHINNHKSSSNSVLIRKDELVEFLINTQANSQN